MKLIYSNANLYDEKSRVISYFGNKASQKNYPYSYSIAMYELINQVYDLCVLSPNIGIFNHKLIDKALNFAIECHSQQYRKYFQLPYIVHPVEMASRMSENDATEEQIAAALLHDVVEDCNISLSFIKQEFGEKVGLLVDDLTDPAVASHYSQEKCFDINFKHFLLSSLDSKNIKIADLLSNTRSILFCDAYFCMSYIPNLEKIINVLLLEKSSLNVELLDRIQKTSVYANKVLHLQKQFNIVKIDRLR